MTIGRNICIYLSSIGQNLMDFKNGKYAHKYFTRICVAVSFDQAQVLHIYSFITTINFYMRRHELTKCEGTEILYLCNTYFDWNFITFFPSKS